MAVVDWPDPEVPCRDAWLDMHGPWLERGPEIPKGCRDLLKLAEANGWTRNRCTYARGTLPVGGTEWKEGNVVDSLVVQLWKDDLRVVASWVAGSFSFAYVYSKSRMDTTAVNSKELRAVLNGELK